jgi:hypothetical protein
MVQDMWEVEYVSRGGGSFVEQTPVVVVPLPGTTPWYRQHLRGQLVSDASMEHRDKRARMNVGDEMDFATTDGIGWWNADHLQSDPRETPLIALLQYDEYGAVHKRLQLNQLVEMVGVVEQHPHSLSDDAAEGGMNWEWPDDAAKPAKDMPRIQVVWYQTMDLDQTAALKTNTPSADPANQEVVLAKLSSALGCAPATGAALWLALLSSAEREPTGKPVLTPYGTTLGCASLHVVVPDEPTMAAVQERLCSVLKRVVPVFQSIDVPAADLPRRYSGHLTPTRWQLPKGSCLLVSLRSSPERIQQLVSSHRLAYHFEGGIQIPFEADYRVIVLSTAQHNPPCTLRVAWRAASAGVTASGDDVAPLLREALAWARSGATTNIALSPEVLQQAENDFVKRRQQHGGQVVGEADFHRWLTLTRLQARSRRVYTAAVQDWQRALILDDAMRGSF